MAESLDEIRSLIESRLDMAEDQDFFGGLGLETSATSKEIQAAYFKLAKVLHPDRLSKMGLDKERGTRVAPSSAGLPMAPRGPAPLPKKRNSPRDR